MNYFGQIDLTKIGIITRRHPELVKKAQFKDGEHMLLNISLYDLQSPDKYGNTATIKARCKKDEQKEGVNYYLGNLKDGSDQGQAQHTEQPVAEEQAYYPPPTDPADLPF